MALILYPDGTSKEVHPANGDHFEYEELTEIVEGTIEMIPLPDGPSNSSFHIRSAFRCQCHDAPIRQRDHLNRSLDNLCQFFILEMITVGRMNFLACPIRIEDQC